MATLFAHGQSVKTLFELMGSTENDMTKSIGWALANSASLRTTFAAELGIPGEFSEKLQIRIQEHVQDGGKTDIEIIDPQFHHHIVIEAKRGFVVPNNEQLQLYAQRFNSRNNLTGINLMVVLAESDRNEQWLSRRVREIGNMNGIPVVGVSWRKIRRMAQDSLEHASNAEKRLLNQLIEYLLKVTTMQNQYSNQVYVVSLSTNEFAVSKNGNSISWIDIIENHQKYFHPVGGGRGRWPIEPPNYVAFRYHASLQSIHHIESYEVIDDDLQNIFDLQGPWKLDAPVYLYTLGTPVPIANEIRTNDPNGVYKTIFPSGRHWCFIDLLLGSESVAEAVALSKERENYQP